MPNIHTLHKCANNALKNLRIRLEICTYPLTMTHRGEVLERAARESGMPMTVLAKRLGKSRRHIYDLFQQAQVPVDTLVEIGKLIHHDFSEELPRLLVPPSEGPKAIASQPTSSYEVEEAQFWKNKYLVLLEKYNALLEEVKGR